MGDKGSTTPNFEEYLLDELGKGNNTIIMTIGIGEDNHPTFYSHPFGKDGTTTDWVVVGPYLISRQTFPMTEGHV